MKIIFMGSGEFGLPTLQALCGEHEVLLVMTQPDRPAGRKRKLTPTPVGLWASSSGIQTIKPDDCNDNDVFDLVKQIEPDAIVVIAYGQYIRKALVHLPQLGMMNLHASLLPKYRGAGPINWAVIDGEKQTGNTVMRVAPTMDGGDILGQQTTAMDPNETAGELHDRLSTMGPGLVLDVLQKLEAGNLEEVVQDESLVTLAPKLSRADGRVSFEQDAETFRNRVHGLTPWPGVTIWWSPCDDDSIVKPLLLRRVEALINYDHQTSQGILVDDGVVTVGEGQAVRLLEVQPPGKRTMSWADFVHGHALKPGSRFYGEPRS